MNTKTIWASACLAALLVASAMSAAAQHAGQPGGQGQAGHQGRGHEAMQAREFRNLQQGRGMGMARAAETNGESQNTNTATTSHPVMPVFVNGDENSQCHQSHNNRKQHLH